MSSHASVKHRVLIVGCGQLGSRHLQAVASLPEVTEIEVVDPRSNALACGQQCLAEVASRSPSVTVRWLSSIEEASRGGGLCIVATQSDVRCRLVKSIAQTVGYSSFLLEKLVAQSVQDYEDLMECTAARGLAIWVNCKTRLHPSHVRVKTQLTPGEPIIFTVIGGNHGLANNGIHAADLFAFYDDASQIQLVGSRIDPVLHPSKRGNRMFDLSGTLQGASEKGSHLTLSFAGHHTAPMYYAILSSRYRAIIDDMMKCFSESRQESGWAWTTTHCDDNLLVSHMMKRVVADILAQGRCDLPTLEQAWVGHRFILEALQPSFSQLMEREMTLCPVT